MQLPTPAVEDMPEARAVCMDWYDGVEGYANPSLMTLAIGFSNGRAQLINFYNTSRYVVIDTGMEVLLSLFLFLCFVLLVFAILFVFLRITNIHR